MKSKRKTIIIISLVAICILVIGCIIFTSGNKQHKYVSDNGWSLEYNDGVFELIENEGNVCFNYLKKSKGEDVVKISYYKDKMPPEVLSRVTCSFPDSMIERTEGYFGNGFDNWSFTTSLANGTRGNGLAETFTAVEHNDGTVLITVIYYQEPFIEDMVTVSDDISGLLDSFELIGHKPQKYLDHVPGRYEICEGAGVNSNEYMVLNKNHTGKIETEEPIDIIWTSTELIDVNSDKRMTYRIDGDKLYIEKGQDSIILQKK